VLSALERNLVRGGALDEDCTTLRDCATLLDSLFLCVVVGEFNSGKSALINGLLGSRACAEGVLPTTSNICLIKHPSVPFETHRISTTGNSPPPIVLDVDIDWLRGATVVDTPGTNSIETAHTELTDNFLPRSDLVLFVTSAERPFAESEQAFMRAVGKWRKKTICVLSKAELLEQQELKSVTEYVKEHAAAALCEQVGVLPVCARQALMLKQLRRDALDHEPPLGAPLEAYARNETERRTAQQWSSFEREVLAVVRRSGSYKLLSQLATASRLLQTYEEAEEAQRALVRSDVDAIGTARARIDQFEQAMLRDGHAQRAKAQLVLAHLAQRGTRFMQDELVLTQLPRLLRRDAFITRFEQRVVADTAEQLERAALDVSDWMGSRTADLLRDTQELLQARLKGATALTSSHYVTTRQELLLVLRQSGKDAMATYEPAQAAQRLIASVHTALAQAALMQAGAAGLSSVVAVKAASLVDLTGLLPAALLAVSGLAVLPIQRYRLQAALNQKVTDLSAALDATLQAHLEQEMLRTTSRAREVVAPFASLVDAAVDAQVARERDLLSSRRDINSLEAEVHALLESELYATK